MKKTIIGFGLISTFALLASASSAMARDYDSYNDKVRACKQQQRNGGVVGGFLGAGAGAAAGRALAASKVRPEGVILGTVVGAVIGSQVGKNTVECGDLEYNNGGQSRYNDNQGRYYGDPRGRSYNEGYVMNGSRPVYDRDGTPEDMYPLGHNDDYYGYAYGNGRPVTPPPMQQSYGYNDGWYVPSQYSYYGQQQQSNYSYSSSQSYGAQVIVSETYSGPTYVPAPPYTPAPVYSMPAPQPMPMPMQMPMQMPAPGQVIQTPQGTFMVVCDGQ